jgi:hypothetical protein
MNRTKHINALTFLAATSGSGRLKTTRCISTLYFKPVSQRKVRKARRQRHAAGDRNAFKR